MSQRGIIYHEGDKRCEYCGKYDECRPYGKNNEQICFACARKDVKGTEEKMGKYLGVE